MHSMSGWGPAVKLIGVGFFIGFSIVAGILFGLWLDRQFDSQPVFIIVGMLIGLFFAILGVYRMLLPLLKDK